MMFKDMCESQEERKVTSKKEKSASRKRMWRQELKQNLPQLHSLSNEKKRIARQTRRKQWLPQEQLVHRNKTAAAMRRLRAHQRVNDPEEFAVSTEKNRITTAKYDETKRRKRAVMTEEELLADRKSKAEARSNQRLKKSMAFFGIDDRMGEERKSEETAQDDQQTDTTTLYHECSMEERRSMLQAPAVEVISKWSPGITIIMRGDNKSST